MLGREDAVANWTNISKFKLHVIPPPGWTAASKGWGIPTQNIKNSHTCLLYCVVSDNSGFCKCVISIQYTVSSLVCWSGRRDWQSSGFLVNCNSSWFAEKCGERKCHMKNSGFCECVF